MQKVKYAINLDWFQLMLSGNVIKEPENAPDKLSFHFDRIKLIKRDRASRNFKVGYDVYFDKAHFARIFCCPSSAFILDKNMIQFEALNEMLYEKDFIGRCEELFLAMDWRVRNVTRIDIALDGQGFFKVFNDFHLERKYEKIGKANYNCHYTGKGKLTGFDIGKRSSNKWVTCYNKTGQLGKDNKAYIKRAWDNVDLCQENDVQRLELKLRNDEIKRIEGFEWTKLADPQYLASVMKLCLTNYFDFVEVSEDKNITRKERIVFIDWDSIGAKPLERGEARKSAETYRLKIASKLMFQIFLSTDKSHYLSLAQELAENANALDWYMDKVGEWESEYRYLQGANRWGEVVRESVLRYIPTYKEYGINEQLRLYRA